MKTTADVVVVGGGIIGCSVARELARRSFDVVLVERHEIAAGASGRNHGLVFYPQDPRTESLYRQSFSIYRELATGELDLAFDERPRGFIVMVSDESEWAAAELEAKACAVGGVSIHEMTADDVRREEPNVAPLLGGWFIDDGYRLDPAVLTLAMALDARSAGADVNTHIDVKSVITHHGKVSGVATDQGIVSAPMVVDAAGPWAPKLARSVGVNLAISGARGWLLLTEALDPIANHLLESSGWHLTAGDPGPQRTSLATYADESSRPVTDIGLLIQQNRTGHVLLGGSRIPSLRDDPEGHDVTLEIARRAVTAIPMLADVGVSAVWSGVRPMSRDGLPLIGKVGGIEGLFIAGGHGGQGVMLGAGSARLLAEIITEETHFTDATDFDPSRASLA
ncbi:MAG: NAD(P)/FAD-dependent oxidoreductase [Actinomycetota bacterium]|nr:FAD-binding oxidoreductase [Actinomycetota bacterium]